MITDHPIVCGYGLQSSEKKLVDYCLSSSATIKLHKTIPPPGELDNHLHFIENTNLQELKNLLDWGYPVLAIKSFFSTDEDENTEFYSQAFELGLSAIWEIPKHGNPVIFPNLNIPSRQGEIIITTDDSILRQHYRQISAFSGFDMRSDFTTAEDIILCLENYLPEKKSQEAEFFPSLIVVDLDSNKIDALFLFNRLSAFLEKNFHNNKKLKLLITKDFSKPGLDARSIDQILRPFAKRIFHPIESIFVFLEAMLLHQNQKSPEMCETKECSFRSLHELLYGKQPSFSMELPAFLPKNISSITSARNIVPFQWLYSYLNSMNTKGLVLAPAL